jgi:hypothetical protein
MSAFRKAALCLLITGVLAAAFSALSWLRLFDFVEIAFYAPAISRDAADKLNVSTRLLDKTFENLNNRFSEALQHDAVRRSVSLNQNELDIFERSRIFGELQSAIPALQWVRLIDASGSRSRIHFSTESADYVIRSDNTAAYRAWTEVPHYTPITTRMLNDTGGIVFDELYGRMIFYMPFYDTRNVKRGAALFAVTSGIIDQTLRAGELLKISEPVSIVSNPNGILIGLRTEADGAPRQTITDIWNSGVLARAVVRSSTNHSFMLFSKKTAQDIFIGFLVDEQLFTVPYFLKILMLICFAVTVFTISFFIMNIKQDAVVIIQNRMKNLQVSLYREYCEHKIDMDWLEWKRELARRREDVREELRRGFSVKKSREVDEYINSFFDKCWDELIAVISNQTKTMLERLDEEKIEDILKRILEASSSLVNSRTDGRAASVKEGAPAPFPGAPSGIKTVSTAIINEIKTKAGLEKAEQERIKQEQLRAEEKIRLRREQDEKKRVAEETRTKEYEAMKTELVTMAQIVEVDPFEGVVGEPGEDADGTDLFYGNFVRTDIPVRKAAEAKISPLPKTRPTAKTALPAKAPPLAKTISAQTSVIPPDSIDNSDPFAGIDGAEVIFDDALEIMADDAFEDELESLEEQPDNYGVEEFTEATEEDLKKIRQAAVQSGPAFTFEDPHKGADIDKVAMRIERSAPAANDRDHDFDMDMDMIIASPANELFNNMSDKTAWVANSGDVISEKDGVPFIKKKTEREEKLDATMTNLVNAVLKR